MPPIIPDLVPDHFPAGTTVTFTRSFGDFSPADGWGYVIYLNGLTQKVSKAATVLNNVFTIVFVPADTAALNPGPYRYAERLTNSITGEVYDVTGDNLVINIGLNVGSAAAGAFNSWDERTLAVINAAISGRLTADIQAYQIAGRSVSKIPIKELRQIRGELIAAIWRQNHPGQLGIPYRVQFGLEPETNDYPPTWTDVTGLGS